MAYDHIDMWEEFHKRDVRNARAELEVNPVYHEAVKAAAMLGLIPPPIFMLEDCTMQYLDKLILFRGIAWVKKETAG